MKVNGKYEDAIQKIMMSCDSFTTGYTAMLLLFFVPYAVQYCGVITAAFLPLVCLLPFAVMPVLYSAVHRADTLLFGRYHLIMPLSAFVAALFFVLIWSSDSASSAAGACLIFFGALVFVIAATLYRYCSFSVRARLAGENIVKPHGAAFCFSAAGAAVAVAAVTGFRYYDETTMFLNAAYVIGAACIILAFSQYLCTYFGIPRLGGRRVQTVKSSFRMLYAGLNKRAYFSALFFEAAFITLAALIVYFGYALGIAVYVPIASASALVVGFALTAYACAKKVKHRSKLLSVSVLLCLFFASAALTVEAVLDLPPDGASACLIGSAALIGAGGAAAERQMRLGFLTVKPRATSGIVFILIELTRLAATAVALAAVIISCAVYAHGGSLYAFPYGFCAAAAFSAVGFISARKRPIKSDALPELSYELGADETSKPGEAQATDSAPAEIAPRAGTGLDK